MLIMPNIFDQEIDTCVQILEKFEPGLLPISLFNQVARLVRLPIVLVIPIRKITDRIEIGLLQRDDADLWWPGMWHLAGTVFRGTDTTQTCIERLLNDELKIQKSDVPQFRSHLEHTSDRGAELLLIYSVEHCELQADSKMEWFSIDGLPATLVSTELRPILELKKQILSTENSRHDEI